MSVAIRRRRTHTLLHSTQYRPRDLMYSHVTIDRHCDWPGQREIWTYLLGRSPSDIFP